PPVWGSRRLEPCELARQCPEGPVQSDVPVDPIDRTGLAVGHQAAPLVALSISKATTDQVLLDDVERAPGVAIRIRSALGRKHLVDRHRGWTFVLGSESSSTEGTALPVGQLQGRELG